MKKRKGNSPKQPTTMIHHVREIQLRLLAVVAVLIAGMVVGYVFYEPLFEFIRAPLSAPLHYMSPAGSFTFIIKICLMIGVLLAIPLAVYNAIMFVQPAFKQQLSRLRVYVTTLVSFVLAGLGAAFGFFVIIPLALRFFYKFQVDGLVALISADEYLRFVVGVIITFVIIFQLPLLMSLIDHITPLPPKKLLKFEKYVIVGSVFIGVAVPFALDPTVQLLIASPIIVLYNLSIGVVLLQQMARSRRRPVEDATRVDTVEEFVVQAQEAAPPVVKPAPVPLQTSAPRPRPRPVGMRSIDGTFRRPLPKLQSPRARTAPPAHTLISDVRPNRSEQSVSPRAAEDSAQGLA